MTGKKHNALKHGANTKEVMLWNERYEDYEALRAELWLEFSPSGSTEEYLVRTLLDLRWRKRRLECYEQFTMQKRLDEIREKREVKRYIEKLCSFADEFEEAKKKEIVETLLDHLEPEYSCFIQTKWPLQAGEDESNWGARIAEGILALKPPAVPEKADEFLAIVDPEAFDTSLERLERLDAMIDRTIKRLMQVRTMKQMNGRLEPKLIDLSATRNPPAQHGGTENRSTDE